MSMQSTDPVADLLTRIRNAIAAGKTEVRMPSSKLKLAVAKQLEKSRYLSAVATETGSPRDTLVITINRDGASPTINEIQRVSTPGRRVYAAAKEIPRVKSGRGVMLVSTSKGIVTDHEARKSGLGGELICKVY